MARRPGGAVTRRRWCAATLRRGSETQRPSHLFFVLGVCGGRGAPPHPPHPRAAPHTRRPPLLTSTAHIASHVQTHSHTSASICHLYGTPPPLKKKPNVKRNKPVKHLSTDEATQIITLCLPSGAGIQQGIPPLGRSGAHISATGVILIHNKMYHATWCKQDPARIYVDHC